MHTSHALFVFNFISIHFIANEKDSYSKKKRCIFITESNMADTEETTPSCDTISHHIIPTERVGALSVWVQGTYYEY